MKQFINLLSPLLKRKDTKAIKRLYFVKEIFDYLDGISNPFEKAEEINAFYLLLNLIEDCVTWEDILKHLQSELERK
jgi:hypothetical protein